MLDGIRKSSVREILQRFVRESEVFWRSNSSVEVIWSRWELSDLHVYSEISDISSRALEKNDALIDVYEVETTRRTFGRTPFQESNTLYISLNAFWVVLVGFELTSVKILLKKMSTELLIESEGRRNK